ncbi:MAG: DUF1501 domain-containing protein [Planctomycetes bacterium]|nr:DUF1501 domain-containing protein [Planctomycetota bacterium]
MNTRTIATRREILTHGLGLVGLGATLPDFLLRSALASKKADGEAPIVVALLLTGGPDGLSLAPPYRNDDYYRNRKVLGIPASDVLKLNDEVGLHPKLPFLKRLYDEGSFAAVLGTSYPNFNLSHFTGREIWEAAKAGVAAGRPGATGWLGRWVDHACADAEPTRNVAVGPGTLPLLLTGLSHPGLGFVSPDSFRYHGDRSEQGLKAYAKLNESPRETAADDLQFITRTAVDANSASARLGELAERYETPVTYPDTQFGSSVRTIAGFINGGLDARAYYAAQGIAVFGGYDTHADQAKRLPVLLTELNDTLAAFHEDLTRCGNATRVLTFTYSEFGRRATENFSGGTDHGQAQPMFVMGGGVKSGVYGVQPSLTDLDERGNLRLTVDFRAVYATILEKYLKAPSEPILGGRYPVLDFIG